MTSYWQAFKEYAAETAINNAFYFVDKDSSGSISVTELKLLVETINGYYDTGIHPKDEDIAHLVAVADKDKDGALSLAEVKAMFNKA